jgi:hypothetical protein
MLKFIPLALGLGLLMFNQWLRFVKNPEGYDDAYILLNVIAIVLVIL